MKSAATTKCHCTLWYPGSGYVADLLANLQLREFFADIRVNPCFWVKRAEPLTRRVEPFCTNCHLELVLPRTDTDLLSIQRVYAKKKHLSMLHLHSSECHQHTLSDCLMERLELMPVISGRGIVYTLNMCYKLLLRHQEQLQIWQIFLFIVLFVCLFCYSR